MVAFLTCHLVTSSMASCYQIISLKKAHHHLYTTLFIPLSSEIEIEVLVKKELMILRQLSCTQQGNNSRKVPKHTSSGPQCLNAMNLFGKSHSGHSTFSELAI